MSKASVARGCPVATGGHRTTREPAMPHALEAAIRGPLGPHRLHEETVVIDENGWYRTLTPSSTWPAANEIFFSNLDIRKSDAEIEAEVDTMVAEYHGRGLPLTWCVFPWTQPMDLVERLEARGAAKSVIKVVIGNTSLPLEIADDVEVVEIKPDTPEGRGLFEEYIGIQTDFHRLPAVEVRLRRDRYWQMLGEESPSLRLFLGRYKGQSAGVGGMRLDEFSAHFNGDIVLPEFQARGIFASLVAARLQALQATTGISLVTGHSNEQSSFWISRFGFRTICSYTICQLDPPSARG